MPQAWRIWQTNTAAAALALALAACSADLGLFSKGDPKVDATFAPNQAPKSGAKQRVVRADDLIDANGACPGGAAPSQALNFTPGPQAGPATSNAPPPDANAAAPPVRTGVALGMTECEVVRAIGHTDRIEISANENGQRSVTLTYLQGARPGIYRFVAGQLVSLERVDEPPPAAKPVKPKPKKQPPA